jgi:hypothetical protein
VPTLTGLGYRGNDQMTDRTAGVHTARSRGRLDFVKSASRGLCANVMIRSGITGAGERGERPRALWTKEAGLKPAATMRGGGGSTEPPPATVTSPSVPRSDCHLRRAAGGVGAACLR